MFCVLLSADFDFRPFEFVNIESFGSMALEFREGHFLENPKTRIAGPAAWIRVQEKSMFVFDGQTTRYNYGDGKLKPEEYLLRYVAGTSNTEAIMAKRQLLMLNLDYQLHAKSPEVSGLDWLNSAMSSIKFCDRQADYVEHRHGENPFRTALVAPYYCNP